MKKIKILLFAIIALLVLNANAQTKISKSTIEKLQFCKWIQTHKSYSYILEFTDQIMKTTLCTNGTNTVICEKYYLSSTPDTKFEPKMARINNNGKYILTNREGRSNDEHSTFEIIELTDTLLTIKSIPGKVKTIGGGATLSFKAMN